MSKEAQKSTFKTINPLYALSHNDRPGTTITHVVLKGSNYEEWAKGFRVSLGAKRKLGFITGSIEQPSSDSEDLEDWLTVNYMIIVWIFNTIDPNLRSTISYRDTAFELWEDIRQRFSVGNGIKIYQLRYDIAACRQKEGETIMEYYGRMKKHWDNINDFDGLPTCTCTGCKCGINAVLRKRRDEDQVQEFLMGLELYYANVCSSVLGLETLPFLHTVYSRINQEEEVRSLTQRQTEVATSNMAFSIRTGSSSGYRSRKCTYYHKTGHTEIKCWKKHGYPEEQGSKHDENRTTNDVTF